MKSKFDDNFAKKKKTKKPWHDHTIQRGKMIRQINSLVVISLMGTSIYLRSRAYRNLSQKFCEMNASSAFISRNIL